MSIITSGLQMPAPVFPGLPTAPAIGLAIASNASATVAFTPSPNNSGSPVTSYTAISTPGSISASSASSPVTVPGLANGTTYTFRVFATNAVGNSSLSGSSNAVTPVAPANVPSQPINAKAFISGQPGHAYVVCQMPANNGSAITSFEALASNGRSYLQPNVPAPLGYGVPSCRVDLSSMPSASTTFQIRARNANGPGPYSAVTNAITPAPFVDTFQGSNAHFILSGGSQIGLSSIWNDTYFVFGNVRFVNPGDASPGGLAGSGVAPAYPAGFGMTNQQMLEVTPQGASGYGVLLNIWEQNIAVLNNGQFCLRDYGFFVFLIYRPFAGVPFMGQAEATLFFESCVTGVAGSTITDAQQNWPVNFLPPASSAIFNRDTAAGVGYTANTASTFQVGGGTWNVGNHYYMAQGDVAYGANVGDFSAFVTSPTPGAVTVGAWNVVKVPVGPTGMDVLGRNNDMFYKALIGGPTPSPNDRFYLCNAGWSVT